MKRILPIIIILILCMSGLLFASDRIEPYNETYFITGNMENQTKYQISVKFNLWYESGLFFTYTQLSKWNLYDKSSPFKETNYNPELMYETNSVKYVDFLRLIPYSHKSNGRDGQESRSMERCFIESQYSYGHTYNVGIREKVGGFYAVSKHNEDIKRYLGFFETELFFQILNRQGFIGHEKISIRGEWTHKFYWYEAGLSVRLFTAYIQPNLYIQYYNGYGEFLQDYNKKTKALRAGLLFNI